MRRLILVFLSVLIFSPLRGQDADAVRRKVLSDWNLSSGLDCIYDMSPKAQTAAPKGYEAFYISHYGRHGSRYAYTGKAYTVILDILSEGRRKDNLTPEGEDLLNRMQPFWDNVRYKVGDLTPLGWEQHQYIAKTMVKAFPGAFGKGAKVDACSSASARSMMSMSSECATISREAPQAQVYAHQSIMDIQATRPNMGINPFRYNGPKNVFPYPETTETFFYRRFPGYKNVLARLFRNTDDCLGDRNPWNVFFNLYMFVAGMNSLPEEERLDVTGFFTKEEFAILWEIDNYERFVEYQPYRTSCSSIVDDMIAKADETFAAKGRGAHLRFGHDHVLMALLMVMDIDGFDTEPQDPDDLICHFQTFRSPKAANIQMVFYKPKKGNGDILVKILLNGEEAKPGNLEGGPYYKWEDLKAYLNARTALFTFRPEDHGWTVTEVAPGLQYREFFGPDPVTGSAQHVYVADWDMSASGYTLKFATSQEAITTSEAMRRSGAIVAMNACYEPPSIVLKEDGKFVSLMPNNCIMTSGVPNWKSDGAVYTDGHKVSMEWTGKGKDLAAQRKAYAEAPWPNIFTSSPMLIDNYVPVGESFAGYLSEDAIKNTNYEDLRRHQAVRHPRSAVALTADNHFLMVVVDGRRAGISEGMSARELTRFLEANFHPRYALNMDGGGSSTLCIDGFGAPGTHVLNYPTDNKKYDHEGERLLYSHFCLIKK